MVVQMKRLPFLHGKYDSCQFDLNLFRLVVFCELKSKSLN